MSALLLKWTCADSDYRLLLIHPSDISLWGDCQSQLTLKADLVILVAKLVQVWVFRSTAHSLVSAKVLFQRVLA